MIRNLVQQESIAFAPEDIAICQRVFDNVCLTSGILDNDRRESIAASILTAYRQGLHDEASLNRLFAQG